MTGRELRYTVPGMSCGHCETAVRSAIESLDGVEHVSVDLETKLVTVCGASVDDGTVRAAIADAGYEASP